MQHNEHRMSGWHVANEGGTGSITAKPLMSERWRKGKSLQHIAQLFNCNHSSVQGILARKG
ncbi:hypothetical protein [Paraburkholderia strydomiana]|uniref:hypothetical protein n=1 Tax=Paraburkholderia strydomiana TaxID=1245417 RepID=UPI0028666521|nr:hypothetical protein [Paraburkholderia strydomiana]MDR7009868.1 hypothetical protein [Paraburkholderia strydomiana]